MTYTLLILAIFISLAASVWFLDQRSRKRIRKTLRKNWGKPKTGTFDFDLIRLLADHQSSPNSHRLSEQTQRDIDIEPLFQYIDRTTSRVGQQYLFKKILEPGDRDTLENWVLLFQTDHRLRELLQTILIKLNQADAYFIAALARMPQKPRPVWYPWLFVSLFLTLFLLALSFVFPVLLIALLLPITANTLIHYWNKSQSYSFIRSIPQLQKLIVAAQKIAEADTLFSEEHVVKSVRDLKPLQRKASLLPFQDSGTLRDELGQVATYLGELLKGAFLIEVFAYHSTVREIENKRESIFSLLYFVGRVDMAISIASLRAGEQGTCIPTFTSASKELSIQKMRHPLVDNCTPNSLTVQGKSILVTGSNMSGKSTFLRTLTVNSILAQTIRTCFAEAFVSPPLNQFTCIRIDDSLLDGKSFFLQEVETILHLLEQVNGEQQALFVLDEVFKGTNTTERIAASAAVLTYLNQGSNIVVVSTHDIGLAALLQSTFDLYHFSETIVHEQLMFDHLLKPGLLQTRNAIKILELAGYPDHVTQQAKQLAGSEERSEKA